MACGGMSGLRHEVNDGESGTVSKIAPAAAFLVLLLHASPLRLHTSQNMGELRTAPPRSLTLAQVEARGHARVLRRSAPRRSVEGATERGGILHRNKDGKG